MVGGGGLRVPESGGCSLRCHAAATCYTRRTCRPAHPAEQDRAPSSLVHWFAVCTCTQAVKSQVLAGLSPCIPPAVDKDRACLRLCLRGSHTASGSSAVSGQAHPCAATALLSHALHALRRASCAEGVPSAACKRGRRCKRGVQSPEQQALATQEHPHPAAPMATRAGRRLACLPASPWPGRAGGH
jgi:hypothetical protein